MNMIEMKKSVARTSALHNYSIAPLLPPVTFFNGVSFTKSTTLTHLRFSPSIASPSVTHHRPSFLMASAQSQSVKPGDTDSDVNIYQVIQSHQETAARLPPVEEVRTLLDRSVRGMLSTFSQKYESYPSGSMVDFACDPNGSPILAVSSLAGHTKVIDGPGFKIGFRSLFIKRKYKLHQKDLSANPKCSLLVARDPEDRTDLVITLHGDAVPVPEKEREAVRASYLKRHPNAFWVDFGDFQFMHIEPKVVHYVSGVATALLGSDGLEFDKETYEGAKVDPISQFSYPVTAHMNKDHTDDTKAIVQHSTKVPVDSAYMLDLDSLGFNVKASYEGNAFKLRIPFPRRAEDRKDVKTLIVEMLQAAKASTQAAI